MRIIQRSVSCFVLIAAAALIPCSSPAQISQADSSAPSAASSSAASSSAASTSAADSARTPLIPIPLAGSIDRELDSNRIISGEDLPFLGSHSLGDILALLPGAFVRDAATPGLGTGLTLRGEGQHSIAVLSDGVLLNEPLTGVFNLPLYPVEQIGRIELIPGTRAFLYAVNGAGGLINIVSKSRTAISPQSRIRYTESAYGFGSVDGSVSQDIIRGLNVTAGVQHTTFDQRFPNSGYDAWSARANVRYNISNSINVHASTLYNGTELGLNGGVALSTPDSLRFEELRADVVNADAYEKLTRFDTQLGITVRPDFDSGAVHSLTLYVSTQLREYRDEENRPLPNGITAAEDHRSQWHGIRWIAQRSIGSHSLDVGAEIASRAVIASPSTGERRTTTKSLFSLATLRPGNEISLSGYARIEEHLSQTRLSFGGDIALHPVPGVELFGGVSRSWRFPTFQETHWNDSVLASSGSATAERHDLLEGGLRYDNRRTLRFELLLFRRSVRDAIVLLYDPAATPSYSYGRRSRETISGLTGELRGRVSWLSGEIRFQYLASGREFSTGLPDWRVECGIYFFDKVVGNHLELKAGLKGTLTAGFPGESFDERRLVYTAGTDAPIGQAGTLDLVLIGHMGDATIHLIWENLLNRRYVTTGFYPMPGRALRFGVTWDFLD